jgi:hypothetical protein
MTKPMTRNMCTAILALIVLTFGGCAVGKFFEREGANFIQGTSDVVGLIDPFGVNVDYIGDLNRSTVSQDPAELANRADEIWCEDYCKYMMGR